MSRNLGNIYKTLQDEGEKGRKLKKKRLQVQAKPR